MEISLKNVRKSYRQLFVYVPNKTTNMIDKSNIGICCRAISNVSITIFTKQKQENQKKSGERGHENRRE